MPQTGAYFVSAAGERRLSIVVFINKVDAVTDGDFGFSGVEAGMSFRGMIFRW